MPGKPIVAMLALMASGTLAAQEPAPPELEFVFEEIVTLGPSISPGDTARGGRLIIPITGGTFEGPGLKGEVMPGGWDWQLRRADGCTDVVADYFLKTDDGVVINVVNTGVICPPGEDGQAQPVRTHPVFEPPLGKYQWMGKTTFVGTLETVPPEQGPAVKIRFYRVN